MIILTIRTDKPEAELGIYDDSSKRLAYLKWQADRQLAETIHIKIKELLDKAGKSWDDISGLVCYEGPGSFTGLRIGFSVANTLAYSQNAPIIVSGGEKWVEHGIKKLLAGKGGKIALPKYGSAPKVTKPRK